MCILAYLNPAASLRRQARRLSRRVYSTKVDHITCMNAWTIHCMALYNNILFVINVSN